MKKCNVLMYVSVAITAMGLLLSGCAQMMSGNHQSISVSTGSVSGATCQLSNHDGTWYIHATPGSVMVHQGYHALYVKCNKEGYQTATKKVASHTRALMAGDALALSPIGATVDVSSGAAYLYPQHIELEMIPVGHAQPKTSTKSPS